MGKPGKQKSTASRRLGFIREAKAASAFDHRDVAHIYEIGEAEPDRRHANYLDGAPEPLAGFESRSRMTYRLEARIARPVDFAHPACTNGLDNPVGPKGVSGASGTGLIVGAAECAFKERAASMR